MECTVITLLKDGDRVCGALGYDRERGRFKLWQAKAVVLATGGIGKAYKITSNSWEYTGDGQSLAYDAGRGVDGHGVRAVSSDGDDLAAECAPAFSSPKGVRGEGRSVAQQGRPPLHVRRHSRQTTNRRRPITPKKAGSTRRATRNSRRPPRIAHAPITSARCIVREVKGRAGAVRTAACSSTSHGSRKKLPNGRGAHQEKSSRVCTISFKQLANIDITTTPMEIGPTTHYVMGGGARRR